MRSGESYPLIVVRNVSLYTEYGRGDRYPAGAVGYVNTSDDGGRCDREGTGISSSCDLIGVRGVGE